MASAAATTDEIPVGVLEVVVEDKKGGGLSLQGIPSELPSEPTDATTSAEDAASDDAATAIGVKVQATVEEA